MLGLKLIYVGKERLILNIGYTAVCINCVDQLKKNFI